MNDKSPSPAVGILTLHLKIPGSRSLKEKRGRIRPLLARLHREFNISAAEIGYLDVWDQALVACVLVSNSNGHTQRVLQRVIAWIERDWPDVTVLDDWIEMLL